MTNYDPLQTKARDLIAARAKATQAVGMAKSESIATSAIPNAAFFYGLNAMSMNGILTLEMKNADFIFRAFQDAADIAQAYLDAIDALSAARAKA